MFPILVSIIFLALLVVDYLFIHPTNPRTWKIMSVIFIGGIVFSWVPESLAVVSNFIGVGRPVDLVIYCTCIILVRELFISRVRYSKQQKTLTDLVQKLAVTNASKVEVNGK